MPEYLAPGVFIEEVSFRSKSIEGVSTTTTGFIGAARFGAVTESPDVITSIGAFERAYGDGQQLAFGAKGDQIAHNFLWHAARSFFEEGGKRLYITRVFRPLSGAYPTVLTEKVGAVTATAPFYADGHARLAVGDPKAVRIVARYPGGSGNLRVRFTVKLGSNLLGALQDPNDATKLVPTVSNLHDGDVVWIRSASLFPEGPSTVGVPAAKLVSELPIFVARKRTGGGWDFVDGGELQPPDFALSDLAVTSAPGSGDAIRAITLSVEILSADGSQSLATYSGLPLDPAHKTGGLPDSIFELFANGLGGRGLPIVLINEDLSNGVELLAALDALTTFNFELTPKEWAAMSPKQLLAGLEKKIERGITGIARLDGGNDGLMPGMTEYEGSADPALDYRTGLKQLEDIEEISIVAAPGSNWNYANRVDDSNAITNLLMTHAASMKYRIAVIDPPQGQSIADVRKLRAKLDSKYAALYYPWVTVFDPITRQTIELPPSGFVAGIYARNDVERGVWKAPANEVVRGAIGFETLINTAQQEVLNPEGINCFRFFEGRGLRLWGARTLSSDPEWKYVNLRRYFAYLERSIDKGTQWAVFEPNGEALWANVRATVRDFMINEWANGALLGDKPEKAFFVRCDRSTMTQNDLDNGRLVCLVGVAPLKPAEFVIFRVGQWTADRQS